MQDIVAHLNKLLSQPSQILLKGKGDDAETDSIEQNPTVLPIHCNHVLFGRTFIYTGSVSAGTRPCSSCTLEPSPNERLAASFVAKDPEIKLHNKRKVSELLILQLWSKHTSLRIPLGPCDFPQKKQKLESSSQCGGNSYDTPGEKKFEP